jgi:microcin C transport system substrate-binding protein
MKLSRHLRHLAPAFLASLALLVTGCSGGSSTDAPADSGSAATDSSAAETPTGGAAATQPAGGTEASATLVEGEWQNAGDFPQVGSPKAKRDRPDHPLKIRWLSYPPTLRVDGPNSNLIQTRNIHFLMYESLIQIHPETEEFAPALANEWRIDTDEAAKTQTFWYRIDERARFSDGRKVTANDVYWSFKHKVSADRKDPSNELVFGQFEEPVVVDERTIKVTTNKLNWRLFLYFGGIYIYPAEYAKISGEEYLKDYNWKMFPGTGPYTLAAKDIKEGQSVTLHRRDDWWAEDTQWGKNTYNFGQVKFLVVRDVELYFEKFKKGEFDLFRVSRSQRWVVEIPQEQIVKDGWVQMRRIFNKAPQGFTGFALNMRRPPFDDVRVRKAFAHLFNIEKLNERLFYDQYGRVRSYIPGRDWGNEANNERINFDPDEAEELLYAAGYQDRNKDGWLVDEDGKILEVTLEYGVPSFQRIWLMVQEDYQKAGIKFNLKLIDQASLIKKVDERQFQLHYQTWGALLFPNPRTSWSSELADQNYNNNVPGFQNDEVDALLERYDVTLDRAEQKKITSRIDEIVFDAHPYALGWYANFERLLFWNRFGTPETYFTKIGEDPIEQVMLLWWWDEEAASKLDAAMASGGKLPVGPETVRPWDEPGK